MEYKELVASKIISNMELSRKKIEKLAMPSLKGVPSAESSRSVRGLGKGVSGKP